MQGEGVKPIAGRMMLEVSGQETWDHVLDAMVNILMVTDVSGRITFANVATHNMLGLPGGDLVGKQIASLLHRHYRERISTWYRDVLATHTCCSGEVMLQLHEGSRVPVLLSVSPVLGAGEAVDAVIVEAADLREKKRLEDQLLQVQKLEAIGQLAAGVAHEINTPIQYIGNNVEFFKTCLTDLVTIQEQLEELAAMNPSDEGALLARKRLEKLKEKVDLKYVLEEMPKAIEQTLEGVASVTEIVCSLKALSHPGTDEKEDHNLNKLLQRAITVTKNEWKYVAEMETDFDDTLPDVPCHVSELTQVILNLIINASHAVAEAIKEREEEKGLIKMSSRLCGDHAEIRVEDNGTGIPAEIQQKIFEPFFTTKGLGQGTGQGLAIVHTIISEKHDGKITVDSKPGRTLFVLTLPLEIHHSSDEGDT